MRHLSSVYRSISELFGVLTWFFIWVGLGIFTSYVAGIPGFTFEAYLICMGIALAHFIVRLIFFFKHKREEEIENHGELL